jgi:DNA repair exonuclease SbcCD ATPase subunit
LGAGLEESAYELTSAAQTDLIVIRQRLDDAIQAQLEKLNRALALNESVRAAEDQFQRASAEKDQLSGLFDDAREHLNQARGEHQKSITAFLSCASDWTANLTELPLPFDQDFLNSVTKWCDRPNGPNPFVTASRNAVDGLTRHFAETRATLSNLEKTHSEELARLESQPDGEPQTAAESRLDAVLDSLDELNRRETTLRMEADAAPAGDAVRAAY